MSRKKRGHDSIVYTELGDIIKTWISLLDIKNEDIKKELGIGSDTLNFLKTVRI